jgi:hypothetical protein
MLPMFLAVLLTKAPIKKEGFKFRLADSICLLPCAHTYNYCLAVEHILVDATCPETTLEPKILTTHQTNKPYRVSHAPGIILLLRLQSHELDTCNLVTPLLAPATCTSRQTSRSLTGKVFYARCIR